MRLESWLHQLSFESDNHLRHYLQAGIKDGFFIVDHGDLVAPYDCNNHSSVLSGDASI